MAACGFMSSSGSKRRLSVEETVDKKVCGRPQPATRALGLPLASRARSGACPGPSWTPMLFAQPPNAVCAPPRPSRPLGTVAAASRRLRLRCLLCDAPRCPPCLPQLQLVLSGARDELKQLARARLEESGWTDEVRQLCRGAPRRRPAAALDAAAGANPKLL